MQSVRRNVLRGAISASRKLRLRRQYGQLHAAQIIVPASIAEKSGLLASNNIET